MMSIENLNEVKIIGTISSKLFVNDNDNTHNDGELNTKIIFDAKRMIGMSHEDIQKSERKWPFEIVRNRARIKLRPNNSKKAYSPEEILSTLLNRLLKTAEHNYNTSLNEAEKNKKISITETVITVPVTFKEKERDSIKAAAVLSGLHVSALITEPMSSFYEYKYDSKLLPGGTVILVADLGGGTFDVSLLEYDETQKADEIFYNGDGTLGGNEFDDVVTNLIKKSIPDRYKNCLEEPNTKAKLINKGEEIKIQLSIKDEVEQVSLFIIQCLYSSLFQIQPVFYQYFDTKFC